MACASKIAFDCHPGHAAWRSWGSWEAARGARKPASPVEPLSTIRKKLMEAFSSRAVLEDTDLEDPLAMGAKVACKQGTEKQEVN